MIAPPTFTATVVRLRAGPICEARKGSRYCPKIGVAVERVGSSSEPEHRRWSPRCPDHAPADAPRMCLTCTGENTSRDPWHCGQCRADAPMEQDR